MEGSIPGELSAGDRLLIRNTIDSFQFPALGPTIGLTYNDAPQIRAELVEKFNFPQVNNHGKLRAFMHELERSGSQQAALALREALALGVRRERDGD